MADIAVTRIVRAGIDLADDIAAALTQKFVNDGKTFLYVFNDSGAPINATIVSQAVRDGNLAVSDRVVAVGAGVAKVIGPFPRNVYNDSDGKITLQISAITSVTVLPLQLVPEST